MKIDARLERQVTDHPYPLLFVTISGAHLYGFPSPDSDFDLRGAHLLPLRDVLGLEAGRETIEASEFREGLEVDLVTHDVAKFFRLMLKKNGYVLEQVCSPLVVQTTPEHEELKSIVPGCLTRHHAHHYLGFAATQWKLFRKETTPRVKPLLYVYRVLLTGIHLMQTGEVQANLAKLNDRFQLPYIADLLEQKINGPEKGTADSIDPILHEREYERLRVMLEEARVRSHLAEQPRGAAALNDLLVRIRLGGK